MRMLKKHVMLNMVPLFWNVARMPEATPRVAGGTAFMMLVVFGAENRPIPTPMSSNSAKNGIAAKSPGRNVSRMKPIVVSSMPPVAKARAPKRSESAPETGPLTMKPTSIGAV